MEILENRPFTLVFKFCTTLDLIAKANPATFSVRRRVALINSLAVIRRIAEANDNVALVFHLAGRFVFAWLTPCA